MKQKLSTYAKEHNISYKTVWRMVKRGQLPFETLPSGTLLILSEAMLPEKTRVVLYARVSSSENKTNLDSQLDRLRLFASAKGYIVVKEVKEIGSGLNDKRKKLEKVLKESEWDILLVEHKDRLARFGVNYISNLLLLLNKRIEVINNVEENSRDDIMQDFVSIITSFTARLYGLRRSKRKTEKIIEDLTSE